MGTFRWTPERMEQLEHAVRRRKARHAPRRGNEYVSSRRHSPRRGSRALAGYLAMTGEELVFVLNDIDHSR